MPSCIVKGCTHYTGMKASNPLLTMHVFPRELGRIKLWLQQIGQNFGDLDNFATKVFAEARTGKYRICSAHFAPGSYTAQGSRIVLKPNAVPTLFPGIYSRAPPDWKPETKSDNMDASTVKAPDQKKEDNVDGTKRLQEGARRNQGAKQSRSQGPAQEQPPDLNGRCTSKDPKTKPTELSLNWTLPIPANINEENRRALWSLENVMVSLLQHLAEAPLTSRSQKQKTTRLLNQTAEIVSVLTGEDWTVVKKNSHISKFYNMIREVPIKVGDVAVFFSMDEWDYIEDHEEHYKPVMVEEPKGLQFNGSSYGSKGDFFPEVRIEQRQSLSDVDVGDCLDFVQTPMLPPLHADTEVAVGRKDIEVLEMSCSSDDFIEPSSEPPQSERIDSSSGDKESKDHQDDEDHQDDPRSAPPSPPRTENQKEKLKTDDNGGDDDGVDDGDDDGDNDADNDDEDKADGDDSSDDDAEEEEKPPAPPADDVTTERVPEPKTTAPPSADAMDESSSSELWIAQDGTTSSTWIPQDDPRPKGRNCFKYGKHAGRIQCPVSLSGTTILLPELPLKIAESDPRCHLCDLTFPDKYELELHQMTHSKKQRL